MHWLAFILISYWISSWGRHTKSITTFFWERKVLSFFSIPNKLFSSNLLTKMAEQSSVENHLTVLNSRNFNFFYSFRPIYYFSRTFGFMPFTIVYDANSKIQEPTIRSLDIFWFIVSIFSYLLSAFISFQNTQNPENSKFAESVILRGADYAIMLSGLIFGVLVIVMDMCNRFKLVGILNNIKIFDEEVSRSECFWIKNTPYSYHVTICDTWH